MIYQYYMRILKELEATGKDVVRQLIEPTFGPPIGEAWHKGKVVAPETGDEYDAWISFDELNEYMPPFAMVKIGKHWFFQGINKYTREKFKKLGLDPYEYKLNEPRRRKKY